MNESSRTTELLLTVSKNARGTLGAQIEGQLRTRIREGALRAGTELPSPRDLGALAARHDERARRTSL